MLPKGLRVVHGWPLLDASRVGLWWLSLEMELCCREGSLGTQHSKTHSEALVLLVQQHTQPSYDVAVKTLLWG